MENLRFLNILVLILFLGMIMLTIYHIQGPNDLVQSQDSIHYKIESNEENRKPDSTLPADFSDHKTNNRRGQIDEKNKTHAIRMQVNGVLYEGFRVDLQKHKLAFFYKNQKGQNLKNLGGLKNYLENQSLKIQFATNAGMFNPKFEPNGLYVENGKELYALNLEKGKGNFYLAPNGVFFITRYGSANIIPSKDYPNISHLVSYATQSGPMLVHQGKINTKFNPNSKHKFTRSGVGLIDKEHLIFVISRKAISLYEFASLFKDHLQCKQALYLDGAISKIYAPSLKRYEIKGNFGAMIAVIQ